MELELDLITIFVCLLVVFFFTLVTYLTYSGLFTGVDVKTREPSYGPMVVAYKTDTGPYRNAGALYTESYCLLPNREQIGIYYDDPEGVPENELRYAVGPILGNAEEPPSASEMEKMRANGFRIAHFPKPHYAVTAVFPFRTTLSIYMAIYKVYPALKSYIASKSLCAYPALEIYTDSQIVFMMPLSKQDEFFVREFQEEEISLATTDMGSVYNDNTDTESRDSRTPHLEEKPRRDSSGFVRPKTPKKVSASSVKSEVSVNAEVSDIVSDLLVEVFEDSGKNSRRLSSTGEEGEGKPGGKDVKEKLENNQGVEGDTTPDEESSEGTVSSFEDIGNDPDIIPAKIIQN